MKRSDSTSDLCLFQEMEGELQEAEANSAELKRQLDSEVESKKQLETKVEEEYWEVPKQVRSLRESIARLSGGGNRNQQKDAVGDYEEVYDAMPQTDTAPKETTPTGTVKIITEPVLEGEPSLEGSYDAYAQDTSEDLTEWGLKVGASAAHVRQLHAQNRTGAEDRKQNEGPTVCPVEFSNLLYVCTSECLYLLLSCRAL
jgi:hypothetical protein